VVVRPETTGNACAQMQIVSRTKEHEEQVLLQFSSIISGKQNFFHLHLKLLGTIKHVI
jgi:hypothetical protein